MVAIQHERPCANMSRCMHMSVRALVLVTALDALAELQLTLATCFGDGLDDTLCDKRIPAERPHYAGLQFLLQIAHDIGSQP